ncbi:addiction module protein [Halochromatium roseum]|uniref:addiction module protein n=1 Tax=Halochromatium roseum TaxID=391920 RepID=UPI001911CB18|nr:addiction module protein [Halochromatium roseum]MBK5938349.1 addiction module antitoxin RelB [Halochromatium roseum]
MKPNLQLDQMSVEEKIQTMELIWDSLSQAPADLESPDWHKEILEERQRKIDTGEAVFLSLDELKARRPQ